jgi:mono/diheme cytochrome c family protein
MRQRDEYPMKRRAARERAGRTVSARYVLAGFLLAVLVVGGGVWYLNVRGEAPVAGTPTAFVATPGQVERGRYLATVGDCITCHTVRGGAVFAGGRMIETPFGGVYSSNLTADVATGIGGWSADEFWRALHNGRSKDGRLLYPAFPYPSFTQVSRADADAIYAYLRTVPAVAQPNRPDAVRFPYDSPVALALWRAMFFRAGVFEPDASKSAQWNRGAYLVRGLGHCDACHANRNIFGATGHQLDLGGGLIPMQNWYAPPLVAAGGAGIADWDRAHIVELLGTGISPRGAAMGPMAEVVHRSTQYLAPSDLLAITGYLQSLPQRTPVPADSEPPPSAQTLARGAQIYADHCASCHGRDGEGAYPAYPPLAGNRSVTETPAANSIHAVISGGYAPATAGNPRPYGMPPFIQSLGEADIAAVLTYVRRSWGNAGTAVTAFDVQRYR